MNSKLIPPIWRDFQKRDFHRWIAHNYNPIALNKQFPQFPLHSLFRVRKGYPKMTMTPRQYQTLKSIIEFGDYHKVEARKLKDFNLAHKYGISVKTVKRHYQHYKTWSGL